MKRSQNLLAGFIAAVVTFGVLFAFAGQKQFNRYRHFRNCDRYEARHLHERDWYRHRESPSVKPDSTQSVNP